MLTSLRSTGEFVAACDHLLELGHPVRFTAEGWSMYPAIRDGETVEVTPIDMTRIRRGDVLLCRLGSGTVAHRVVRLDWAAPATPAIVLRGDAAFADDAPLAPGAILGLVISTTRAGVRLPLDTSTARLIGPLVARAWRVRRWLYEHLRV